METRLETVERQVPQYFRHFVKSDAGFVTDLMTRLYGRSDVSPDVRQFLPAVPREYKVAVACFDPSFFSESAAYNPATMNYDSTRT